MVLNPDFKEFLQLLNVHEVRYLIVGGYHSIKKSIKLTTGQFSNDRQGLRFTGTKMPRVFNLAY